jgi:hypothetical protein
MSQGGTLGEDGVLPPDIPTTFQTDNGSAVPIGNVLEVLGDLAPAGSDPVFTEGSGNTVTINIQTAQAIAASNANNVGLAAFSADDFNVDANGFVTLDTPPEDLTITGDFGGPLSPILNNWNILGQQAGSIAVMDTIGSGSTLNIEDRSWPSRFVVDPSSTVGLRGTFQTITAALAAASSGDDVFIRATTAPYTENVTLKAGVNLIAFGGDDLTPSVTILGNVTATFSGRATLSGIRLQTNSAACLTVSGANATIINLKNCYINCSNNTGISYTSSNASSQINIIDSFGDTGTTGISYFSDSSAGTLMLHNCIFLNTGASSTACTKSAGDLRILYSVFRLPLTYSSTGVTALINFSNVLTASTNSTFLTTSGTGTLTINSSTVSTGSATSISIGAGTTVRMTISSLNSTNTNVISGAGILEYGALSFNGTSSNINPTTQTILNEGPSRTIGSSNSGGTNTLTVTNTSNTASSQALQQVTVGGGTAGDAFTTYTVSGVTNWSHGIDNSDGDAYVLAASTALGTTNVFSATTAGAASFVLGNVDVTKSASGVDVSMTASNASNTASSSATYYATVAGTSGGDPRIQYAVAGTTTWTEGIDNSVTGDPFVIAASNALGTTNIMSSTTAGEINYPLQPAFLATTGGTSDVTGDGTAATIAFATEIFDQNNDYDGSTTFTAPVTGRYVLSVGLFANQYDAAHTSSIFNIVTSNRTYRGAQFNAANVMSSANAAGFSHTSLCDMDAADTATVTFTVTGGTKVVDVVGVSSFRGYLAC